MFTTTTNQMVELLIGGRSNVYLVRNTGKTMLVDTSTRVNRYRLDGQLSKLRIAAVDYLLLTHIHFDHIDNAQHIARKYGAKIAIPASARALVENRENEPIKGNFFLTRLIGLAGNWLYNKKGYEQFFPDILCPDNFDLAELGFCGTLLATPGHTAFSMSLVLDDEVALVGDTLFGIVPNSVMPPYATDRAALIESWQKLYATGARVFLPGHGKPISREQLEKAL